MGRDEVSIKCYAGDGNFNAYLFLNELWFVWDKRNCSYYGDVSQKKLSHIAVVSFVCLPVCLFLFCFAF